MQANMSKTSRRDRLQKFVVGLGKHFQPTDKLQVGGVSYAVSDLTVLIQADVDATNTSAKARAEWSSTVQAERNAHAKVAPILRQLEGLVTGMFGDTQDAVSTLEDFGLSPRKRTKPSAETQVEANAKAKATRNAKNPAAKASQATAGTAPAAPAAPIAPKP